MMTSTKKMKGLVFGKFYPFHTGHENLIRFAKDRCDILTVLVCASDREKLSGQLRAKWISHTYKDTPGIQVQAFSYSEHDLPSTSVSSRSVSRLWADSFSKNLEPFDIVFTGEPYGDYVAEFMNVSHIRYSGEKKISATQIRSDIQKYWSFINTNAHQDLVKKVVILGTESSGKSTLATYLANRFNAGLVEETGRDVVESSNSCTQDDLQNILSLHASRIQRTLPKAERLLVIDTDCHITESYGRFLFNVSLPVTPEVRQLNRGDLYLYLDNDAPFVQDGTRLDKRLRNTLDRSHKKVLSEANISYELLQGSFSEKYQKAAQLVESLIPSRL